MEILDPNTYLTSWSTQSPMLFNSNSLLLHSNRSNPWSSNAGWIGISKEILGISIWNAGNPVETEEWIFWILNIHSTTYTTNIFIQNIRSSSWYLVQYSLTRSQTVLHIFAKLDHDMSCRIRFIDHESFPWSNCRGFYIPFQFHIPRSSFFLHSICPKGQTHCDEHPLSVQNVCFTTRKRGVRLKVEWPRAALGNPMWWMELPVSQPTNQPTKRPMDLVSWRNT